MQDEFSYDILCPLIISSAGNHKFQFITSLQIFKIGSLQGFGHTAAGGLNIHDDGCPTIYVRDIYAAVRLDKDT